MEDMADLKTQFIVTMNQDNPDCAIIAHLQKKTFMERMLENHLHTCTTKIHNVSFLGGGEICKSHVGHV